MTVAAADLPVLDVDGLRIRPARAADGPDLAAAGNDPLTQRFVPSAPNDLETARRWVDAPAGQGFRLVITTTDEALVGAIGFDERRPGAHELTCWVATPARRRGIASRSVRAVSEAVARYGLHRLEIITGVTNEASQRVALNAGFVREGMRRKSQLDPAGQPLDDILWGRLPDDPPGPAARPLPDLPRGELTDGVAVIRRCTVDDVDDLLGLFSVPDVYSRLIDIRPRTRAEIERRCVLAASRWLAGERADLVVRHMPSGDFVGDAQLIPDPRTGEAEIAGNVMPQWRGRGHASRALALVSQWAFDAVGSKRVIAGTAPDNQAGHTVLGQAGFVREAVHVARIPGPDDSRVDEVLHVRLAPGVRETEGRR